MRQPALLIIFLLLTAARAHAASPILGASGDEHVWLVVQSDDPAQGVQLMHQPVDDGFSIQTMFSLPRMPVALAAWGDRLWLVFPVEGEGDDRRRETYTVQVRRDPTTEMHLLTPRDRLGAVASLPGDGELAGFAGTADGPVALIVPTLATRAADVAPETSGPRLLSLRGDTWIDSALPPIDPSRSWYLLIGGARGQFPSILTDDPDRRDRAVMISQGADDTWTRRPLDLDLDRMVTTTRADRHPVVVQAGEPDTLDLAFVRPGRLTHLATLPRPDRPWALHGTRIDVRIFEQSGEGMVVRRIDAVRGTTAEEQALGPPVSSGRVWYVSVLLAITITALMFAFLVRPGSGAADVTLPAGEHVLGLGSRFGALLIDLFPGALLAVLVLDCRPIDLATMPLATADPSETGPYLMMVLVTILHSSITELLTARTLGKAMVGARVATLDGAKPSRRQILTRNIFKLCTMLVPPLAVIIMFNPNVQGLGDVVARTLVVFEPETPADKDR